MKKTLFLNALIWGIGSSIFGLAIAFQIAAINSFSWNPLRDKFVLALDLSLLYGTVGLAGGFLVGLIMGLVLRLFLRNGFLSDRLRGATLVFHATLFVLVACFAIVLRTFTHIEADIATFVRYTYILGAALIVLFGVSILFRVARKTMPWFGIISLGLCLAVLIVTNLILRGVDQPDRRQLSIKAELAAQDKMPSRNFLQAGVEGNRVEYLGVTIERLSHNPKKLPKPKKVSRMVVFALDGASWNVLERLLNEGKVPRIRSIMNSGVHAKMQTVKPLLSPVIWTTIATGKKPKEHGITSFTVWLLPGMTEPFNELPGGTGAFRLLHGTMPDMELPVASSVRKTKAIWNICGENGLSTGVVGWWGSWPAESIDGFIVSDRLTYGYEEGTFRKPEEIIGVTHPPNLLSETAPLVRYPETISSEQAARYMSARGFSKEIAGPHDPVRMFRVALSTSESYSKIGISLYDKFSPDLFLLYLQGIGLVSHYFWREFFPGAWGNVTTEGIDDYGNVIRAFYEYQDEIIGECLKKVGPDDYVMILSDHGFEPCLKPRYPTVNGQHSTEAVFILKGPGIRKGVEIEDVSVLDMTPTMLYALGCPVAADMQGRVILECFEKDYLTQNNLRYLESYDSETSGKEFKRSLVDEEVKARLKSIGYIE